jgi:hypothetical protein
LKGGDNVKEVFITERRKIVVQKSFFKGAATLDVRTYINTEKYTGPTRKGVNIPLAKARELAQAILAEISVPEQETRRWGESGSRQSWLKPSGKGAKY